MLRTIDVLKDNCMDVSEGRREKGERGRENGEQHLDSKAGLD